MFFGTKKCVKVQQTFYLEKSSSGNQSPVVELIMKYQLNVKVAFLGTNLDAAVAFMDRYILN